MNAKMSQHLTLLGLCAMIFYGVMLASGTLSVEVMPQFVISALIFLTSGRLLRRTSRAAAEDEESAEKPRRPGFETDWPWLTALLNWTAALLVMAVLALFILKPVGVSFSEAFQHSSAHEHYYSSAIP